MNYVCFGNENRIGSFCSTIYKTVSENNSVRSVVVTHGQSNTTHIYCAVVYERIILGISYKVNVYGVKNVNFCKCSITFGIKIILCQNTIIQRTSIVVA